MHCTTLVVLPGLDGTDVFLRPLLKALPESIETRFVEFPADVADSYEGLLECVRTQVAGIERFDVLASSFSGPLAILLAASEPERVRSLMLAATFARFPRPGLRRFRFAIAWPVFLLVRAARRIPLLLARGEGDAWRRAKAETWSRASARTLTRRLRWLLDVDVREQLRACGQPILCLAFRGDPVVPADSAREIVELAKRATLITLPGAHLGIWSEARSVAGEVTRFLGLSSNLRKAATESTREEHGAATLAH